MIDQYDPIQMPTASPLSDEYVNAVIRQHGYQSPEAVSARLYQWIGLYGGENGVTLLIYEAHKALVKLRAPVADDPEAFENAWKNRPYLIMGVTDKDKARRWWYAGRAALSAQPASSSPSPAAGQRQATVPGLRESGSSHTDGGAVYE